MDIDVSSEFIIELSVLYHYIEIQVILSLVYEDFLRNDTKFTPISVIIIKLNYICQTTPPAQCPSSSTASYHYYCPTIQIEGP